MVDNIARRLYEKRVNFSSYQWEGGYNWLYDKIRCCGDIKKYLTKPLPQTPPDYCSRTEESEWKRKWASLGEDTNTRIIIMSHIIPIISDLLSRKEREELECLIKSHLACDRMCDIGYSTSYADNEDATTVAQSARYVLSHLEKTSPTGDFRMAKAIAYGRVGLLGNPSDMYGGKCISFTFDRFAEVEVKDSLEWRIESLEGVDNNLNYNGRNDLVKAVIDFLGIKNLPPLAINYKSNIPRGYGLAGSSAIAIATLRAINDHFRWCLDKFDIAEMATHMENDKLKIAAGFQDRYVISFEGICYMDFEGKEYMRKEDPHGKVERLDIGQIPYFLVLSGKPKESATVHNPLRERFLNGDKTVMHYMNRIAALACEGKHYLLVKDWERVGELMNRNHYLRNEIGLFREDDNIIVEEALACGALGAKTAGSGGAVVVLTDEHDEKGVFNRMMALHGDKCFKPNIVR